MYATSKLIIPPKPARNIPYIPKLRIKLRPSLVKGRSVKQDGVLNTSSRGKNLIDRDLKDAYVYSRFMNGESRQSDESQTLDLQDESNVCDENSAPPKFRTQGTFVRRSASKKQHVVLTEDIDIDGPESVLTKINLKAIINRETFYALPVEAQRMLADLLPVYDRHKHTWSSFTGLDTEPDDAKLTPDSSVANDDSSVWLHPSALSNEFFGKALQDYASRQAQGDFAPRVRNRAGLRTSANNRCRYMLPVSAESPQEKVTTRSFPCNSTPRLNHVRRTPQTSRTKPSVISSQTNGQLRKRKLISGSSQVSPRENTSIPTLKVKKSTTVKLTKFGSIRQSRRSARFSRPPDLDLNPPKTDSVSPHQCEEASDLLGHYPSALESVVSVDDSDVTGQLASAEIKLPSPIATCGTHSTESKPTTGLTSLSPLSRQSTEQESLQKRARKLSVVPQSSPTPVHPLPNENKYASPLGSPRSTRVSRALSSTLDSPVPSPMPPPRQTKTLAAVREKLRAKRMMKEAERQSPGQSYYSLPGSMTPHPASGASGYFHQPSSYPSNGGFGVLSTDSTKRSSSALSSPRSLQSLSPRPCDKQLTTNQVTSMETATLHSDTESDLNKILPTSPASPCSLPGAELLSPLPNLCLTAELPSLLSDQDHPTFSLDFAGQSYPSSPRSSTSPVAMNGPLSFEPTRSPQSARSGIAPCHFEFPHEQSTSAPPTPSTHQTGQTLLCSFSNVSPSSILSSGVHTNNTGLAQHCITAVSVPNSPSQVTLKFPSLCTTLPNDTTTVLKPPVSPLLDPTITGHSVTKNQVVLPTAFNLPSVSTSSPVRSSQLIPSLFASVSTNSPVLSQTLQSASTFGQVSLPRDTAACNTTPSYTISSSSIPSAVSQLLVGAGSSSSNGSNSSSNGGNNKPSTTTRAFFVDGDNLSQALALLQSLNPNATITQQQFLLIPSANKSQMFLLRPPSSKSPSVAASQPPTTLSVPACQTNPSTTTVVRQPASSVVASPIPPSSSCEMKSMVDTQQVSCSSSAANILPSVPNQMLAKTLSTPSCESATFPVNIRPRLVPTELTVPIYQQPSAAPPPLPPRALVCSTANLSSPTLLPLKPPPSHTRPLSNVDLDQDRVGPKPRSVSPKIALPPTHSNKVSAAAATVLCANPTAQSQITLSLLTSSPSLLGNEAPLVFLTDSLRPAPTVVHPNTRQVSLLQANVVEQAYSVYTQSSTGTTTLLTPSPVTVINPSSSSLPPLASQLPAIPAPSFYTNSFSALSREPTLPHYTATLGGNKFVTTDQPHTVIQTNPVNCYPTTMVQTLPVTYLPAATIVSHCSPALVFPHTVQTLQPDQTHLVSRDNGIQFSRHPV
ncbi:hypothetical protein CSKR_202702 [Clonorchis sinensis]|uniref:ASX DEUBAD domain-containing protein n=2 Tax=Clonorchis sinensis TaxID=79923 RepID=A0A3R7D398_CLOSI|nr:hypothetical protein CSKR_202702 [Clonorchis sinensis]